MKPLAERLTERVLLQRGDFALSYRARDAVLDRPVFIKLLNRALAQDATIRARFEREAKAVARLDHPNLVRIYEYGEDPHEGPYMLLEWVEGETLAARFAGGERLTGEPFAELARQLLSGLAALHSVGILHRDLKPDNVLVKTRGRQESPPFIPPTEVGGKDRSTPPYPPAEAGGNTTYKITDFSLAALRDAPKLTHHEAIVGTPAYMAPEQAAGSAPTEASDLFAVGVILYEAATGVNPLLGDSLLDTLRKIRESTISFESAAIANLSSNCRNLLKALLERNPALRPGSATQAIRLLDGEAPVPGRLPSRPAITTRYALAVIAIVGIIAFLLLYRPTPLGPRFALRDQRIEPPGPSTSSTIPDLRRAGTDAAESLNVATDSFASVKSPPPKESASLAATLRETAAKSETHPPLASDIVRVDSVDLWLMTEPWAHVVIHGVQVGTTPLAFPLRLAGGRQNVELRNPAFPPISVQLVLDQPTVRETVKLLNHVATVRANVEPWGELYLDGEHIGTTPLPRSVYVLPGQHNIRVSHPQFAALQQDVQLAAGEVVLVRAELAHSKLSIQRENKPLP